jgi:hypothetical protein
MMAMTKVMEAMVFTMEVTNVGDVYLRLAKYMFRVKLTLHDEGHGALKCLLSHVGIFVQVFLFFRFLLSLLKRLKKRGTVSVI